MDLCRPVTPVRVLPEMFEAMKAGNMFSPATQNFFNDESVVEQMVRDHGLSENLSSNYAETLPPTNVGYGNVANFILQRAEAQENQKKKKTTEAAPFKSTLISALTETLPPMPLFPPLDEVALSVFGEYPEVTRPSIPLPENNGCEKRSARKLIPIKPKTTKKRKAATQDGCTTKPKMAKRNKRRMTTKPKLQNAKNRKDGNQGARTAKKRVAKKIKPPKPRADKRARSKNKKRATKENDGKKNQDVKALFITKQKHAISLDENENDLIQLREAAKLRFEKEKLSSRRKAFAARKTMHANAFVPIFRANEKGHKLESGKRAPCRIMGQGIFERKMSQKTASEIANKLNSLFRRRSKSQGSVLGIYTPLERDERLERYRKKRRQVRRTLADRTIALTKKNSAVKYLVRRTLSNSQPRVNGRFTSSGNK